MTSDSFYAYNWIKSTQKPSQKVSVVNLSAGFQYAYLSTFWNSCVTSERISVGRHPYHLIDLYKNFVSSLGRLGRILLKL